MEKKPDQTPRVANCVEYVFKVTVIEGKGEHWNVAGAIIDGLRNIYSNYALDEGPKKITINWLAHYGYKIIVERPRKHVLQLPWWSYRGEPQKPTTKG